MREEARLIGSGVAGLVRSGLALGMVAASITLAGCVSVNATRLDPSKEYAPVPEREVRIFLDDERVPTAYVNVALVYAEASTEWRDESDLMNRMRQIAAGLGANGLIVRGMEEPGTVERVAAAVFDSETNRRSKAVAIRYGDLVPDSVANDTCPRTSNSISDTVTIERRRERGR